MNTIRPADSPPFDLHINWDGAPIVSAERLEPLDWNLALHRDASDSCWCVSDIETGVLVVMCADRDDALRNAYNRLQDESEKIGTTIDRFLKSARKRVEYIQYHDPSC